MTDYHQANDGNHQTFQQPQLNTPFDQQTQGGETMFNSQATGQPNLPNQQPQPQPQ